jgi:hypothetical protein
MPDGLTRERTSYDTCISRRSATSAERLYQIIVSAPGAPEAFGARGREAGDVLGKRP